jgi:hypothetical protein
MNRSRERLAWIILLLSCAACVGLAIGVPLGVRQFIRTSRVAQEVTLEPQRGTPVMQRGGLGSVEALVAPVTNVYPDTIVTTDETAQGLLTLYAPGQEPSVAAVAQIYNSTRVAFVSGRSPRFRVSPLPHEAVLRIATGRMRVTVTPAHGRPTVVRLLTPHAEATLSEGSYEVRVYNGLSELTVRSGYAQITSGDGQTILLGTSERAVARGDSGTLRRLPGERNLIENGSFDQGLTEWTIYHKNVQAEPGGAVEVGNYVGRTAARFRRPQDDLGHAEVGIRQEVNYDVRDFTSLTLHLNVQILYQSLPGCGSLGSECPILLRITYKDIDGTDRDWYKGFYAVDVAESDFLAPWDEQIPAGTWYPFDSGNLVELFERPPARIKEVYIYASGHAFDALATEIELLAQE